MVTAGRTLTVNSAVLEQLCSSVTVTVYVPALSTSIDWEVAFVFQRYDEPLEAVNVVVCPWQIVCWPLMVTVDN